MISSRVSLQQAPLYVGVQKALVNTQTIQIPEVKLPITRQIAEQARVQPDAIALRHGDLELTYKDLQQRVDQMAEYIGRQAQVIEGAVAICLERSIDLVIAALAVMRAGAAYVPLDPSWPEARVRYAVEQSGAAVLIARAPMLNQLKLNVPGIDPRRDATAINVMPRKESETALESLAYIIYTSGSTGTPKGVEITHANLASLAKWHREAFNLSPQDRASHLAGLGFDASVWEIWPTLCAGASLCIPTEGVLASPDTARDWLLDRGVTIAFVPSIYAARMMEMDWPASTALRTLLTGGDVLSQAPKRRLPFAVVNNYGPTECTVVATSTIVQTGDAETPSIGKAIAGTTVYLLDENQQEVPSGSAGEIYLGGDKVARGYRNQPLLTKERFIPDPFSSSAGARLYRTGDLGALQADGQIKFMGRVDRQVKIRGKRLELDEVGNVLARHSYLSFATVVVAGTTSEDRHLVAYIMSKTGKTVTRDDLQRHLAQHLPNYMIPSIFVSLQHVPLTANGKLDFAALPAPSASNTLEYGFREATDAPTEERLLGIIQGLLHGKSIGVDDNVFLAGGDSLLGMQLIIEVKENFGIELAFDQIFEAPTVEDLARIIDDQLVVAATDGIAEEAAPRAASNGVLSLKKSASANQIFWVHYLNVTLDHALGHDRPMTFLVLTPEDMEALGSAPTLKMIAARFVRKIVATQPEGPYIVGGFCIGAVLAYEVVTQLRKEGRAVDSLMMLDAPGPSYLRLAKPMAMKLSDPVFVIKRMKKLGLKGTWQKILNRVSKPRPVGEETVTRKVITRDFLKGQKVIEDAATSYEADQYEGKVLLMLAAENAPHVNFLPEWQTVIPAELECKYIPAHHEELMQGANVQYIADTMNAHLQSLYA